VFRLQPDTNAATWSTSRNRSSCCKVETTLGSRGCHLSLRSYETCMTSTRSLRIDLGFSTSLTLRYVQWYIGLGHGSEVLDVKCPKNNVLYALFLSWCCLITMSRNRFFYLLYMLAISGLYSMEWQDCRWPMNQKGHRMKQLWCHWDTIPWFPWKSWEIPEMKFSVRMVGVAAVSASRALLLLVSYNFIGA
jgi:hypothetical protein